MVLCLMLSFNSCGRQKLSINDELRTRLTALAENSAGTVGIAIILPDNDTLTVNNSADYPLMSVFKLHQAVASCRTLDNRSIDLSEAIDIKRDEINPDTWSPMAKDFPDRDIRLQLGALLDYMLVFSDNNASNLLFDRVVSVTECDSIIKSLDIDNHFNLRHTEREMQSDHDLAYSNVSSPMACAALIKAAVTDSLMSTGKQKAIISMLGDCQSAPDRIKAGIAGIDGARIFHRTGSGYTNGRGEIIAVNDVAYVTLDDERGFALAVMVKDYPGSQDEASALIAEIASTAAGIISSGSAIR